VSSFREAPEGPRPSTPDESRALFHAEVEGLPFLVYRDGEGQQRLLRLPPDQDELTIGRNAAAGLCLGWDEEVSALHAQLERVAGEYVIVDDGLSRNGSHLNGERVHGRRRLRDGDMLRLGRTVVLFRHPKATSHATRVTPEALTAAALSGQQRKVLIALCRPFKEGRAFATPATNQQIGEELFLSVDTVKLHLRALFDKFDVAGLPQNKKRLALVRRALDSGLVSERDL
jgi:pSer/pThr/pTyr-binding forkhead associated (FHA) protein